MTSRLERDFPWLAPYVLAMGACDLSVTRDVNLARYERPIEECLVRMLQAEYRKNATFAAFLQSAEAGLARDVMRAWMCHAAPTAFDRVTGLNAAANHLREMMA